MGNVAAVKETSKVEEILREYKYVQIKVRDIQRMISDINNNVPGVLKGICYDGIKTGATNNISKMIENKVMKKQDIIDELEIQIYALNRNNRIIDDTLVAMGQVYERLFYYKYIEELQNKEIAQELKVSEMQVSRLLRRLLKRMEKMLITEEE